MRNMNRDPTDSSNVNILLLTPSAVLSGVAAGLAATDPKLVPYGAMTATFYTGMGCLLCPSILFFIVRGVLG